MSNGVWTWIVLWITIAGGLLLLAYCDDLETKFETLEKDVSVINLELEDLDSRYDLRYEKRKVKTVEEIIELCNLRHLDDQKENCIPCGDGWGWLMPDGFCYGKGLE